MLTQCRLAPPSPGYAEREAKSRASVARGPESLTGPRDPARVSIVGLGYVGLSTAVSFASRGIPVVGVDVDQEKLAALRKGDPPLHEAGLAPLLRGAVREGTLTCTDDTRSAVLSSSITFITVGTPSREDGSMDTSYVQAASAQIGAALGEKRTYHVVVVKSTVLPGTSRNLVLPALEEASGKKQGVGFGLAVNPEFLREGSAVNDTLRPDALILGPFDRRGRRVLTSLYKRFYRRLPPMIVASPENVELVKYSINTFRGVQLSFLNTLANVAAGTKDGDVGEVIRGLTAVTGIDERYRKPGLGYGGSCLPKDLRAFVAYGESTGTDMRLMRSALEANALQPSELVKMAEAASGGLKGKHVAVLGLAFKADTDDVRESPSIILVKELVKRGAEVCAYDPAASANAEKELGGSVEFASSVSECLRGSECCFIATDWKAFKLKPSVFRELMARPLVIDGRRTYDPGEFQGSGVEYRAVGRGTSSSA